MKKLVTFVPNVRVNLLLCCSAAVLLSACGAGTGDTAAGQQPQTAALSYDSATSTSGPSVAGADDSTAAATAPSGTEAGAEPTAATTDDSTAAAANPSSTEAASATGTDGSTRLLAQSAAVPATTKNLYVSPTGSDSNPGTQAKPVKTIARADALASAGYTIHVAPGTYKVAAPSSGSVGLRTSKSGTSSARIKFVSDVKWGAKLVMSGTGILWNSKGSYVDIDGFDISGSGRIGILAEGGNLTINNNFIHDLMITGGCNGSGGAAIDTAGPLGNAVISGNIVRNIGYRFVAPGNCNTVQGIYISNQKNIVTNNIVSGVAAVGIQQWHAGTASTIVNNTVFHNKVGIVIGQGDAGATAAGSKDNYVANNIVYDNKIYGVQEFGKVGGNNRYVNNLVASNGTNWKAKGTISGSISSNPLFVNYQATGSGNFRVKTGSPAINRGTSLNAPKVDFAGVARPRGGAFDIGAYEY
jgi:hypothetical protein